jgi:rhodanese-related sulfurtransferase
MPTIITREALKAKIDAGEDFVLVDVLPPESYREEHLPDAINIPVTEIESEAPARLPRDRDIVVYCGSFECQASPTAAKALEGLGFTRVLDYEGGLADWEDAGHPIVSASKQTIG